MSQPSVKMTETTDHLESKIKPGRTGLLEMCKPVVYSYHCFLHPGTIYFCHFQPCTINPQLAIATFTSSFHDRSPFFFSSGVQLSV